jgi:protocatechuate 3,4-dioxygenase beta subunit
MPGVFVRVAGVLIVASLVWSHANQGVAADPQVIRGVVTLPDGQPAANTEVWLVETVWLSPSENGEFSRSRIQESTKTDAAGRFTFRAAPPAEDFRDRLAVVARDAAGRLAWVTSYAHLNWGDLRLAPADVAVCVGRVLDEAGQPLAGVEVVAVNLNVAKIENEGSSSFVLLPPELAQDYRATTAADGAFSIPRLPRQGSVTARFTRSGDAPLRADWNLGSPLELRLARPGALAIQLAAQDPAGGANRSVSVRRAEQPGLAYRSHYYVESKTDVEGRLRLEGLPPGEYTINVGDDESGPRWYAKSEVSAKVAADQTAEVAIELLPGIAVSGRVIQAATDQGIAGVSVQIANVVDHSLIYNGSATTDQEGRFTGFTKSGQVYVTVTQTPDTYSVPPEATKAEAGDQQTLELPPIALTRSIPVEGIVRDAAGKPVAGAAVYVTAPPPFGDRLRREFLTTDEHGRFKVTGLPSDDGFTLHAYTESAVSDGGLIVVPNKQRGEVELLVKPELGYRLRGRVVDEQGKPLKDIPVRIMWYRGYFSRHSQLSAVGSMLPPVVTDGEGRFESRLLWPQDRYGAQIFTPGFELHSPPSRSDAWWVGSPADTQTVPDIVLKREK